MLRITYQTIHNKYALPCYFIIYQTAKRNAASENAENYLEISINPTLFFMDRR